MGLVVPQGPRLLSARECALGITAGLLAGGGGETGGKGEGRRGRGGGGEGRGAEREWGEREERESERKLLAPGALVTVSSIGPPDCQL